MNFLFVCTGNTCRSPMAACLMTARMREAGMNGSADSAGLHAVRGMKANQNAHIAVAELGLDLFGHAAKSFTSELARGKIVLCMSENHADAARTLSRFDDVFALSEYAGMAGDIIDPFGGDLNAYRACLRAIDQRIQRIIANGGMRA